MRLMLYFLAIFVFSLCSHAQHWYVTVSLENKQELSGVVLNHDSIDIKQAGIDDGLRLWYVGNNKGFLYISYQQVGEILKISSLSDEDVEQIVENIQLERYQRNLKLLKEAAKEASQERESDSQQKEREKQQRKQQAQFEKKVMLALDDALRQLPKKYRQLLEKYPYQVGTKGA